MTRRLPSAGGRSVSSSAASYAAPTVSSSSPERRERLVARAFVAVPPPWLAGAEPGPVLPALFLGSAAAAGGGFAAPAAREFPTLAVSWPAESRPASPVFATMQRRRNRAPSARSCSEKVNACYGYTPPCIPDGNDRRSRTSAHRGETTAWGIGTALAQARLGRYRQIDVRRGAARAPSGE